MLNNSSLCIFREQHWIERILNEYFGFHPLHANSRILLQNWGYHEQLTSITRISFNTDSLALFV